MEGEEQSENIFYTYLIIFHIYDYLFLNFYL